MSRYDHVWDRYEQYLTGRTRYPRLLTNIMHWVSRVINFTVCEYRHDCKRNISFFHSSMLLGSIFTTILSCFLSIRPYGIMLGMICGTV